MQQAEMARRHGIVGGQPGLTGLGAIQVLAYWWRARGRFWEGWFDAIGKLRGSGLPIDQESLSRQLTRKQARIVWDAQLDAARYLQANASEVTVMPWRDSQVSRDAKVMMERFLTGRKELPIPPLPEVEPPRGAPQPIRLPSFPWWLLLLIGVAISEGE